MKPGYYSTSLARVNWVRATVKVCLAVHSRPGRHLHTCRSFPPIYLLYHARTVGVVMLRSREYAGGLEPRSFVGRRKRMKGPSEELLLSSSPHISARNDDATPLKYELRSPSDQKDSTLICTAVRKSAYVCIGDTDFGSVYPHSPHTKAS